MSLAGLLLGLILSVAKGAFGDLFRALGLASALAVTRSRRLSAEYPFLPYAKRALVMLPRRPFPPAENPWKYKRADAIAELDEAGFADENNLPAEFSMAKVGARERVGDGEREKEREKADAVVSEGVTWWKEKNGTYSMALEVGKEGRSGGPCRCVSASLGRCICWLSSTHTLALLSLFSCDQKFAPASLFLALYARYPTVRQWRAPFLLRLVVCTATAALPSWSLNQDVSNEMSNTS